MTDETGVPVEELEGLADEWRKIAEGPDGIRYKHGLRDGHEACAKSLEALIRGYTDEC